MPTRRTRRSRNCRRPIQPAPKAAPSRSATPSPITTARFGEITRRARAHFESRDWAAARGDAVARIELYDRCIGEISIALGIHLGEQREDRRLWSVVRNRYAVLIAGLVDQELYKTFFNTLTRRFFKTRGVAADIEFVALDIEPTDRITHPVARHSYAVSGDLAGDSRAGPGRLPILDRLRGRARRCRSHRVGPACAAVAAGRERPAGDRIAGHRVLSRAPRLSGRSRVQPRILLALRDRAGAR